MVKPSPVPWCTIVRNMFTGIVQAVGTVRLVKPQGSGLRLLVDPLTFGHHPRLGDSLCVSGCCLTLAEEVGPSTSGLWAFDAIPETLAKTTLSHFKPGRRVNLEPAVTAATPMGGHVVQGHVDAIGRVVAIRTAGDWRVRIAPAAPQALRLIIPKGSICVDGVSLTVAEVDPARGDFEVALIPTTLEKTTLAELRVGDQVNLETDILVRTIVNCIEHLDLTRSVKRSPSRPGHVRPAAKPKTAARRTATPRAATKRRRR